MTGVLGAISDFSEIPPLMGPTVEDFAFLGAAMGWVKNLDFTVTWDNRRGPLSRYWVISW